MGNHRRGSAPRLARQDNTAGGVWADAAYRSAANETFLNKNGFVSHIHRKKPKGRVMLETVRRANNAKSKIRSRVEHVFAEQKDRMGLFIRILGIARATAKIEMANLVYNIKCVVSHDRLVLRKANSLTHYPIASGQINGWCPRDSAPLKLPR
jgi:transposase, IS5 family